MQVMAEDTALSAPQPFKHRSVPPSLPPPGPAAQVTAEDMALLRVALEMGDNPGYQFKTHPNIDKQLYSSQNTLGLKDPDRPFPTGAPLGERRVECIRVV